MAQWYCRVSTHKFAPNRVWKLDCHLAVSQPKGLGGDNDEVSFFFFDIASGSKRGQSEVTDQWCCLE
jgi:hypothetical protein